MGAETSAAGTISADEFAALELKVVRAVEIIRSEREARATAESELASAHSEIASLREQLTTAGAAQKEVESLTRERESVRLRVEKMLAQMDELL